MSHSHQVGPPGQFTALEEKASDVSDNLILPNYMEARVDEAIKKVIIVDTKRNLQLTLLDIPNTDSTTKPTLVWAVLPNNKLIIILFSAKTSVYQWDLTDLHAGNNKSENPFQLKELIFGSPVPDLTAMNKNEVAFVTSNHSSPWAECVIYILDLNTQSMKSFPFLLCKRDWMRVKDNRLFYEPNTKNLYYISVHCEGDAFPYDYSLILSRVDRRQNKIILLKKHSQTYRPGKIQQLSSPHDELIAVRVIESGAGFFRRLLGSFDNSIELNQIAIYNLLYPSYPPQVIIRLNSRVFAILPLPGGFLASLNEEGTFEFWDIHFPKKCFAKLETPFKDGRYLGIYLTSDNKINIQFDCGQVYLGDGRYRDLPPGNQSYDLPLECVEYINNFYPNLIIKGTGDTLNRDTSSLILEYLKINPLSHSRRLHDEKLKSANANARADTNTSAVVYDIKSGAGPRYFDAKAVPPIHVPTPREEIDESLKKFKQALSGEFAHISTFKEFKMNPETLAAEILVLFDERLIGFDPKSRALVANLERVSKDLDVFIGICKAPDSKEGLSEELSADDQEQQAEWQRNKFSLAKGHLEKIIENLKKCSDGLRLTF